MEKNSTSADELKAIRKYMEESTRFLSLSGFSGLFPGLFALAGALVVHFLIIDEGDLSYNDFFRNLTSVESATVSWQIAATALSVLLISLLAAFYFSYRNARMAGKSFWTPVSKRMLFHLSIPLISGGLFTTILAVQEHNQLIVPSLLVFYGLALINAWKFTYNEILYLGILEILTGLFCALFPGMWMICWITGFGILHICYGLFMYFKYEK